MLTLRIKVKVDIAGNLMRAAEVCDPSLTSLSSEYLPGKTTALTTELSAYLLFVSLPQDVTAEKYTAKWLASF